MKKSKLNTKYIFVIAFIIMSCIGITNSFNSNETANLNEMTHFSQESEPVEKYLKNPTILEEISYMDPKCQESPYPTTHEEFLIKEDPQIAFVGTDMDGDDLNAYYVIIMANLQCFFPIMMRMMI